MTDFIAPLVDFTTDFDRRRDALSWRPSKRRPFTTDNTHTSWQRMTDYSLSAHTILSRIGRKIIIFIYFYPFCKRFVFFI